MMSLLNGMKMVAVHLSHLFAQVVDPWDIVKALVIKVIANSWLNRNTIVLLFVRKLYIVDL